MKLFYNKEDLTDAKSKDSVLRLLYAYKKYEDVNGEKGALSFRKHQTYNNEDKDIENAIINANNNADFEYMRSIIKFLYINDYLAKVGKEYENIEYYMLTKSGMLFFENYSFENILKEDRHLSLENFYKFMTILIAAIAIISPIIFNKINTKEIETKINILETKIKLIESKNINYPIDTISH